MHLASTIIAIKLKKVLYGAVLVFVIIIARLFYLQIYRAEYFFVRSQKNYTRYEQVESLRGNIIDAQSRLLATNRPIACLFWKGTGNRAMTAEHHLLLQKVGNIVQKDFAADDIYNKIVVGERKKQKVLLASDLTFIQLSQLLEQFSLHPNLVIDTQFKRFYPYKKSASHIIGYLGNVRMIPDGKQGLEKIFNMDLSGKQGATQSVVNSVGQSLSYIELEKAFSGGTIQTTIDIEIQSLCEKAFSEYYTGSFIVLDPSDGSVVSLLSRPNFDPNIFLEPISMITWQSLQEHNSFLNRALDASYPSGSIFKLITISAALEHAIISAHDIWDCKGYTVFGKRKYWCGRKAGHGEISMIQAVAESCNTLFFEIGKNIDIDILADYAHAFGLGEKTNTLFPEKSGLVPSRQWKLDFKRERWWPGETLSVAIGQSFLLVTPMQIARMIGSIFTGYLVSPRFLTNEPIVTVPLMIKPETIDFLKKSMKMVVRHGTGKVVRTIQDMKIYAKTSTAQTSDLKKRALDPKYLEHGWFVCYFQYKEHKPLVMVILVERVGAAHVAATIAKNFLIDYKKYMDCST